MNPWLSILIPSINYTDLGNFLSSLEYNAFQYKSVEIIVDSQPGIVSSYERMIKNAKGEFIWIANDNLTCESRDWDKSFHDACKTFDDGIVMVYPNDTIFEETFACFPILRKDIFERLLPMPYQKYKIDDSIQDIFPQDRKIYLNEVIMRHAVNIEKKACFITKNGSKYPVDEYIGRIDQYRYLQLKKKRELIKAELCQSLQLSL